jgi:SAM-dependent methyltransferase
MSEWEIVEMSGDKEGEYTDDLITKLEWIFSEDFLSPGGREEVAKIVENIDLEGKEVLDIGVGIGGPACILIEDHGAALVTGIDVEEPVLHKAAGLVSSRGLQDRIILKQVNPGPLPFGDESFDAVFSKDSIIHIPDKEALFKEVLRVLRPGGWVVMGDWYCSEEPFTEEMSDWVKTAGLSFAMTPIRNDEALLGKVGFVDCRTLDRNAWFADLCQKTVERLAGLDFDAIVAALGQEDADHLLSQAKKRAVVSAQGQLRPGHLRGRKPA